MEVLKKKLNSRQGASILLALLFMLVCMMAGASILMAAASDEGRIRSNKEEQQKYLTVSSALNLLVDELEKVEYTGKYYYARTTVYRYIDQEGAVYGSEELTEEEKNKRDENGILIYTPVFDHYVHTYTQQVGELTSESDWVDKILDLSKYMEYTFAENFALPEYVTDPKITDDKFYCVSRLNDGNPNKLDPASKPENSYTLYLTAELTDDEKETYGDLSKTVRVKFELREDGSFILTGTLMEEEKNADGTVKKDAAGNPVLRETQYIMTAVVRPDPNVDPKQQFSLSSNAVGGTNYITVTWVLDKFTKGAYKE